MQRLLGFIVPVTAAGGAIGLETSTRLLQEGAILSLIDISSNALENTLVMLAQLVADSEVDSRMLNMTSEREVEKYTNKTVTRFGGLD